MMVRIWTMTLRNRILPNDRISILQKNLQAGSNMKFIEVHNGLSALIANTTKISTKDGSDREFDGFWISSLTDSAAKGHPDTSVISTDSRLLTLQQIVHVTDKPIIVDGDTGGDEVQFEYCCSKLENLGVSAIIIEDKQLPKRNSLVEGTIQFLEDPFKFAKKIKRGKKACLSKYFMIFARIESFIAGTGLEDSLSRAKIYLEAGVDGIFIHSKDNSPNEIYSFLAGYENICQQLNIRKPIVCAPTSYNKVSEIELFNRGVNIVIYANHLLRAAHKAMKKACLSILRHERSFESTNNMSSIDEISKQVGFLDVKEKDKLEKQTKSTLIISTDDNLEQSIKDRFGDHPISNVKIGNKTLLQHQVESITKKGLNYSIIISSRQADEIAMKHRKLIKNAQYKKPNFLYNLFSPKKILKDGFFIISDNIFFNPQLIKQLEHSTQDIILVIDKLSDFKKNHSNQKIMDYVVLTEELSNDTSHYLKMVKTSIKSIGRDIRPHNATHEFIGIAKFSKNGAQTFLNTAHDLQKKLNERSMKSTQAVNNLNTILREIIRLDHQQIHALEVNADWIRIEEFNHVIEAEKLLS